MNEDAELDITYEQRFVHVDSAQKAIHRPYRRCENGTYRCYNLLIRMNCAGVHCVWDELCK